MWRQARHRRIIEHLLANGRQHHHLVHVVAEDVPQAGEDSQMPLHPQGMGGNEIILHQPGHQALDVHGRG